MGNIIRVIGDLTEAQRKVNLDTEFKYQPDLTKELDAHEKEADINFLLRVVLWKLNRYVPVDDGIVVLLNRFKDGTGALSERDVILRLLNLDGVNLPMASTILRFMMPKRYQIIDQRAYRVVTGKALVIPTNKEERIDLYLSYLNELRFTAEKFEIAFEEADRKLYIIDKRVNGHIPLNNYGTRQKVEGQELK